MGDLPYMYLASDARTPGDALLAYCDVAEDWADKVMQGEDLSASYPIAIDPTPEHADLLYGRIEFIRERLVPIAGAPDRISKVAI